MAVHNITEAMDEMKKIGNCQGWGEALELAQEKDWPIEVQMTLREVWHGKVKGLCTKEEDSE